LEKIFAEGNKNISNRSIHINARTLRWNTKVEPTWKGKKSMSLRGDFVEVSAHHMIAQKVINFFTQTLYADAGWSRLTSKDGTAAL